MGLAFVGRQLRLPMAENSEICFFLHRRTVSRILRGSRRNESNRPQIQYDSLRFASARHRLEPLEASRTRHAIYSSSPARWRRVQARPFLFRWPYQRRGLRRAGTYICTCAMLAARPQHLELYLNGSDTEVIVFSDRASKLDVLVVLLHQTPDEIFILLGRLKPKNDVCQSLPRESEEACCGTYNSCLLFVSPCWSL